MLGDSDSPATRDGSHCGGQHGSTVEVAPLLQPSRTRCIHGPIRVVWSVFYVGAAGTRWQPHVGEPSTIAGLDGAAPGQRERQLRHWHGKAEDKDEQSAAPRGNTSDAPGVQINKTGRSPSEKEEDFLDLI